MILQTDSRLKEWTNKYGCAVMCIFFLVNKKTGLELSPEIIESYIDSGDHCFTSDRDVYWDKFFNHLGCNVSVKKAGRAESPENGTFEINQWYNPRTKHSHFVVGYGEIVCYDPLGESVTCREGYLKDKRIIKFI